MKKVVFVTGTRADFGKLCPLMKEVDESPNFECNIFATGMHMLAKYGYTYMEIERAGFSNVFPHFNQTATDSNNMDLALAQTVCGLGYYIREIMPDMIVVHGDRLETLAGAIVGVFNNILVAHIEGGDVSGTVDELIRHSVTKLSHLHFVANEESRNRIIQLGEADGAVFTIGSPDIDVMLSDALPSRKDVMKRYGILFEKYGIFLYHSVTTELDSLKARVDQVFDGLKASNHNYVAIYPNNDAGSEYILQELIKMENHERFRVLPSLRFEYFLTLLKNAEFIIGNSSAGVREAPVYSVPSVNLGSRQNNRFRYESILNVNECSKAIVDALNKLPRGVAPSHHFGRGDSAKRFMKILKTKETWSTSTQKCFQDISFFKK